MANPSWEAQFEMIREGQGALTAIEFSSKPVVMAIYDVICKGGFTIRRRSSNAVTALFEQRAISFSD
jgi:hypothetical protein